MNDFITTQRQAVMQEIKTINREFKYAREAYEYAQANNDEQIMAYWKNVERNICERADKVWGLLDTIDAYIETIS